MTQKLTDLERLFALAYGDCQEPEKRCRLLQFKTEPMSDLEAVKKLVRLIGQYNEFDPDKVCAAIDKIGSKVMAFEVGREYSPVMYVELPCWNHQMIENKGDVVGARRPLEELEVATLKTLVKDALQGAKPDELDEDRSGAIRAWWD